MFVPGSAEFFNMNKRQIADHPEVTTFFERMTFLPLEHITAMVPPGGAGIGMHVIPVEKAIETENRSADIEHISHWLKKPDIFVGGDVCTVLSFFAVMRIHDFCALFGAFNKPHYRL